MPLPPSQTRPPSQLSPQRRDDILSALRRGAVPQKGLDRLAVGLQPFERAIDEELERVSQGSGVFKAIRGEYGTGKTFCVRWIEERALQQGLASAEVQISESETPLHRLETVYRRAMESLHTRNTQPGSLQHIIEQWFFTLEREAIARPDIDPNDDEAIEQAVSQLMEERLARISQSAPQFSATLRAYQQAMARMDTATAQGLLAWLSGQPNVGAAIKRQAGLKGELDNDSARSFLRGLLTILRDSGVPGLVLVLDEVETLQRVRSDVRQRSLNALRQLIDEVDGGKLPGLYVVITGTPAFFDGPQGVQRLEPLAQRLNTDFDTDPRFDNPRAVQLRLRGFSREHLLELGIKIRDLYAEGASEPGRICSVVNDTYIASLADALIGEFRGAVQVAPRIFLKKLVADVLDRVDLHPDFDPLQHYRLTLNAGELSPEEQHAAFGSVDEIELDLD